MNDHTIWKHLLLASACISASAGAQSVKPADADAAVGDQGEIVVTAQKKTERLIDVPLAVSSVGAETLTRENLNGLRDYFARVPGLQYSGEGTASISIRGITTGERLANPTTAILVDDVPFGSSSYLGQASVPDFDPATLERIEVLRGPQGTLYGASSLGGLIKYVTKAPDARSFFGRVEVDANHVADGAEGFSARGSINVPIIADRVAMSVSGFYRVDAPYVDNIDRSSGIRFRDTNKGKFWGGRAALQAEVTEAVTVNLSALKQRSSTTGDDAFTVFSGTDFRPVFPTNSTANPQYRQPLGKRTTSNVLANGDTDFQLYSARVNADLGFADFASISAWSRSKVVTISDGTNQFGFLLGPYPGYSQVLFGNGSRTSKFSQEVRLSNNGPLFDWLIGGFYTKEKSDTPQSLSVAGGGTTLIPYDAFNPSTYRDIAAFGDVTVHVSRQFDVQLGLRYSSNKQSYSYIQVIDPASQPIFGPSSTISSGLKEDAVTWLVAPSYHLTPDILLYGRVASGYRPGGPNANLPTIPLTTFGSDKVISYELGAKGKLADGGPTFDISIYQIDWKDIQLQNTDQASGFVYFSNGAKARSRGAEASTSWSPWDKFEIGANASYSDSKLTRSLPPQVGGIQSLIGASGDRLPNVPKFAANFSAQQGFGLTDTLSGFIGATYTFVDKRIGQFVSVAAGQRTILPSYSNIDLRAGIESQDKWQLTFFVRNLLDKQGVLNLTNAGGAQSVPTATFRQPRTIGFTLSGDF